MSPSSEMEARARAWAYVRKANADVRMRRSLSEPRKQDGAEQRKPSAYELEQRERRRRRLLVERDADEGAMPPMQQVEEVWIEALMDRRQGDLARELEQLPANLSGAGSPTRPIFIPFPFLEDFCRERPLLPSRFRRSGATGDLAVEVASEPSSCGAREELCDFFPADPAAAPPPRAFRSPSSTARRAAARPASAPPRRSVAPDLARPHSAGGAHRPASPPTRNGPAWRPQTAGPLGRAEAGAHGLRPASARPRAPRPATAGAARRPATAQPGRVAWARELRTPFARREHAGGEPRGLEWASRPAFAGLPRVPPAPPRPCAPAPPPRRPRAPAARR
jgi:hypothetical protein